MPENASDSLPGYMSRYVSEVRIDVGQHVENYMSERDTVYTNCGIHYSACQPSNREVSMHVNVRTQSSLLEPITAATKALQPSTEQHLTAAITAVTIASLTHSGAVEVKFRKRKSKAVLQTQQ